MPWMPEVFSALIAEAKRPQEAEATSTNDVVPYYGRPSQTNPKPSFAPSPHSSPSSTIPESATLRALRMPEASSSTLDTVWRVNNCETCCGPALARWRGRDEHRDSVMYCESLGTH